MTLLAVAAGSLFGFLFAHRLFDKQSSKKLLLGGLFFGFSSAALFLSGFYFHHSQDILIGLELLIVGRLLAGLWIGSYLYVVNAYANDMLDKEEI